VSSQSHDLLTILQELEPDAGWKADPIQTWCCRSGNDYCEPQATGTRVWKVSLSRKTSECAEWRTVVGYSEDFRTAVRMALAGYRSVT
jgi:hypothetical protein